MSESQEEKNYNHLAYPEGYETHINSIQISFNITAQINTNFIFRSYEDSRQPMQWKHAYHDDEQPFSDASFSHYSYARSSDDQQENTSFQSNFEVQSIDYERQQQQRGLSIQNINTFPEMMWKTTHNYFNKGEKCSFCLQQYRINDILRVVKCMHRFHKQCIDEWLKSKTTCPLCKLDFKHQFKEQ